MKKVLLVTHVGDFIPQFEMGNVQILQEQGCEVHYAANFELSSYGNSGERLKHSGIICHQLPMQRSPFAKKNFTAYRQLKELMARERFDLVHCHTPVGGALARLAARRFRACGCRVLYTAHGFHFFQGAPKMNWFLYYPVERFLSRWTDVQLVINEEDYRRAAHFPVKRVVKLPGVGIDTGRLCRRELDNREEFRRELGVEPEEFCLLSVGELDANKNQQLILQAMAGMSCSGIRCLICGKGEEQERLRQLRDRLGLGEIVRFLGYRNDVGRLYEAADAFVFPSHREGLSVALMEAMAKGLPAVASRIRGNIDLIDPEAGGILFDSDDAAALGAAIGRLSKDAAVREAMGEHNRARVREFDRSRVREIMQKLYREVLT